MRLLREAGAVILGKTNLHEFAYGITSISSLGGQTRNPYNPQRVPGGSSGGSAAAVAAGFATIATASDTCGSIRIPAAFNNLAGLRPSKGLSSIYGIMPLASTPDVGGPLARHIEDLAIVLDLTTGYDPQDSATAIMLSQVRPQFQRQLESTPIKGLRIGRLTTLMDSATPEVAEMMNEAFMHLHELGAMIVDFTLPDMSRLISASALIGHEFESDLNAYLQTFGSSRYNSLQSIVDSGLYHEAVAALLQRSAASEQDPTAYSVALAARKSLQSAIDAVMAEYQLEVIAYLPMGIELLGPYMSDATLLSIGHAIEKAWHKRRAPDLESHH